MLNKRRAYVLKLSEDNDEKEVQFEIDFQLTLSTQERFEMMFAISNKMKEMLIRNGHRRPIEIIKRV